MEAKAEAVEVDRLEDLAALCDPDGALHRRSPDRAFGVDADAIGAILHLGPDTLVREVAVSRDVEGKGVRKAFRTLRAAGGVEPPASAMREG
jgi:hypothetical protein